MHQGKAGKYTEYSGATGITKDEGQSTLQNSLKSHSMEGKLNHSFPDCVSHLTAAIGKFASDREWSKFHLPRNLMLALLGELGELAEIFQWKRDEDQYLDDVELDKIGQEIADVSIYLLRMADVCGVCLQQPLSSELSAGQCGACSA
jgi:dCTP diphosphatase